MACNPLPLIVPCHRVVRSDGSLGGFSSPEGPAQKIRLLKHENSHLVLQKSGRGAKAAAHPARLRGTPRNQILKSA